MSKKKSAWIGIISSVVAVMALLFITLFPNLIFFWSIFILWFGFFGLLFWKFGVNKNQTALHFMTAMSFVVLLLLVESSFFRWFLVFAVGFIFFFIFYWSEPRVLHAIYLKEKPLRRMMMMLYVFNVYAFCIGLFAVDIFFPSTSFTFLSVLAGAYSGLGAYMIWNLYFKLKPAQLLIWSLVVTLFVFELMWVMRLLPFGYLALGMLVTWLWYLGQLFIRFHLSSKGIIWKKQKVFLLSNLVLYILTLYFIQWI